MLKDILRQKLLDNARTGCPATYKQLADQLGLAPPNTTRRIAEALEGLVDEDAAAGFDTPDLIEARELLDELA